VRYAHLDGIVVREPRPGWVTLEVPPLEAWQNRLRSLLPEAAGAWRPALLGKRSNHGPPAIGLPGWGCTMRAQGSGLLWMRCGGVANQGDWNTTDGQHGVGRRAACGAHRPCRRDRPGQKFSFKHNAGEVADAEAD
jgi:hypothetical protein